MPLDVLFVRDDDIPDLVQQDVCDLGIVGLNVIEEKRLALQGARHRPCSSRSWCSTSASAACRSPCPTACEYRGISSLHGKRIATTYPNILARYLRQNDVQAEIVTLSGAVEIAPRLGRADFICDLVSTGSTLVANHLWEADTILESQAAIISTPCRSPTEKQEWLHRLSMRIDGVQQVKESKYIMLHAPRAKLPEITKLLPAASRRRSFRSTAARQGRGARRLSRETCSGKRSKA
jgi:ATP phosphoribosyltransferase